MTGAKVQITGADTLARTLHAAGKDLQDWAAVNADAAAKVEVDAKRRAPHRTGALGHSISAASDQGGAQVAAIARYARYVEYGTRRSPARPFLRPALDTATIVPLYEAHINQAIRHVKGA